MDYVKDKNCTTLSEYHRTLSLRVLNINAVYNEDFCALMIIFITCCQFFVKYLYLVDICIVMLRVNCFF